MVLLVVRPKSAKTPIRYCEKLGPTAWRVVNEYDGLWLLSPSPTCTGNGCTSEEREGGREGAILLGEINVDIRAL